MNTQGLIFNFLGDSITEGHSVEDIAHNRFDNVLKELCGLKEVRNYGIGGTRIAHQHRASVNAWWDLDFCGRAERMAQDADVVIVFGGTNDYGHGDAPFGQVGDTTRNTFCGSVRCLMEILVRRHPTAKLIFMTPARRLGDEKPSTSEHRYVPGLPLKAYVDAIKEIAKDYPFAVLDMYKKLGIDPNQETDRIKYTAEGLHFNNAGHRVIAERLCDFLAEL